MTSQYHVISNPSPDNVATPTNSNEMFVLENANLNVIQGADATIMTFYHDFISVAQGGTDTVYVEGHNLMLSAQEATTPTLVNVWNAGWWTGTQFEVNNPLTGKPAPITQSTDGHGGTMLSAGNVSFDLKYVGWVSPTQLIQH